MGCPDAGVIYADIFSLFKPGVLDEMAAGRMGPFPTTQGSLFTVAILLLIPAALVALSITLKPRVNRWTNVILGVLYTFVNIGNLLGEAWAFIREHAWRLWQCMPLALSGIAATGRDLMGTLTPGGVLIRQAALLEQYLRVVRELSQRKPLLLILDDLQWADSGSINLLSHLGKRIQGSRVMIIGTYRSTEVAMGRQAQRHPLEPIVNELKHQFGEIHISLGESEAQRFVNALVDRSASIRASPSRRRTCSGIFSLGIPLRV